MERVNIDKVYHPFITGAYNKIVGEMMQETGARINVPPPSVNKNEIVITGEKEQVALAVALIKKIHEEKVRWRQQKIRLSRTMFSSCQKVQTAGLYISCRRRVRPRLRWR